MKTFRNIFRWKPLLSRQRRSQLDWPCWCIPCVAMRMTADARHSCLKEHHVLLWGGDALQAEAAHNRVKKDVMRKSA